MHISIYISLTKGQQSAFKRFLSGGNDAIAISDKFLRDQLNSSINKKELTIYFQLMNAFKKALICK